MEGTGASSTSKHAEGLHSNMYKPTSTNGKDVDHARATEKGHAAMMHMSSSHLYQLHMGNLSGCYPKGKGVGDDFQVHPFFPDPQQLFAHPANLPYFQNADVCPKGQMAPAFPYNQADWTHYQQLVRRDACVAFSSHVLTFYLSSCHLLRVISLCKNLTDRLAMGQVPVIPRRMKTTTVRRRRSIFILAASARHRVSYPMEPSAAVTTVQDAPRHRRTCHRSCSMVL